MSAIIARSFLHRICRVVAPLAMACLLAACGQIDLAPHLRPLSKDTMMLLGKKGMDPQSPIFIRVFKEESELEVWKLRADGHFYHFKTYPICNWSGDLGPKLKIGDRQAPEGFYTVSRSQMNPDSKYHLAFNLGFPNSFDKAHGRTGEYLMVHGRCKSVGCYAMTDGLMEEIYSLARESFLGGNDSFQVHAFPFRMTDENMRRHAGSVHATFWATMKEGYDYFEYSRQLPNIAVCSRRYVVNVTLRNGDTPRALDASASCPQFVRPKLVQFVPPPGEVQAQGQVVVPGPKYHNPEGSDPATRSGITKAEGRTGGQSRMSLAAPY